MTPVDLRRTILKYGFQIKRHHDLPTPLSVSGRFPSTSHFIVTGIRESKCQSLKTNLEVVTDTQIKIFKETSMTKQKF